MSDQIIYKLIMDNPSIKALVDANDFAGATTALNNKNIQKKNNSLVTARKVMLTFTNVVNAEQMLTEADVILASLQGSSHPRTKAAYESLTASGLDISDDQVQGMIPIIAVAESWPAGLADRLMAMGVYNVSLVEEKGLEDVTQEQVENAWAKETLFHTYEQQMDIVRPFANDRNKTDLVAALRSAADTIEAL